MLSDSLKIESTIEHLLSQARQNPRDRTTMVSLDTTPNIMVQHHSHFGSPFFRVLYDVSSLDAINTKSVYLPQAFPICSYIPSVTAMIPFPWVSFICYLVVPAIILWTKDFESTTLPLPLFNSFSPPQFGGSVLKSSHIFRSSPSRFWSRKHHCLGQLQVSLYRWQHTYFVG